MDIKDLIRKEAHVLGFHAVGFAAVEPLDKEIEHFRRWLHHGHHAGMSYLKKWLDVRHDPSHQGMVAGANTVVSFALAYDTSPTPAGLARHLAFFARGSDYHHILHRNLTMLLKKIKKADPEVRGRALVDSAPLLERAWAVRAGLGWIGRNTTLIHPDLGSMTVLGELVLSANLAPTPRRELPGCGECRACVEACPTGALAVPDGHILDSRRCLSYWTIEANEHLPKEIGRHDAFFGCDQCQIVCPWNQEISVVDTPLKSLSRWDGVTLNDVAAMPQTQLEGLIRGTSLERAGPDKLAQRARTLVQRYSS